MGQDHSGTLNVVYLFIVRPRGTSDWGMGLVCGPAVDIPGKHAANDGILLVKSC